MATALTAASAVLSKARRPEPESLVIGGRRAALAFRRENSSSFSQHQTAAIGLCALPGCSPDPPPPLDAAAQSA
jgi:hypothetical protein